jgi:hypothetical protein
MTDAMREFERIVEYCYQSKEEQFVIRFLDNTSYILRVADLPKKMQTRKPKWEEATLNADQNGIIVQAGEEFREIPSHIVHSRGNLLT